MGLLHEKYILVNGKHYLRNDTAKNYGYSILPRKLKHLSAVIKRLSKATVGALP